MFRRKRDKKLYDRIKALELQVLRYRMRTVDEQKQLYTVLKDVYEEQMHQTELIHDKLITVECLLGQLVKVKEDQMECDISKDWLFKL